MSIPSENLIDISSRQTIELIRDLLDKKHPESYMLYSLDSAANNQLTYQKDLFHNKV